MKGEAAGPLPSLKCWQSAEVLLREGGEDAAKCTPSLNMN